MSKKTVVAVAEYLRQQTGDPNLAPRPVLRSLVESGRIGAVSGKGWYDGYTTTCYVYTFV